MVYSHNNGDVLISCWRRDDYLLGTCADVLLSIGSLFLAGYVTGPTPTPGPSTPMPPAPAPKKPTPTPAPKTSTPSELQVAPAPTLNLKESLQAFLLREWVRGGGEKRWWVDRVEANPERFERLQAAFVAVWGSAPLNQQKLALALCLVETGCGFGETRN